MKIRIKSNSIRLRLSQSEVQELHDKGSVSDTTYFGPQAPLFSYRLETNLHLTKIEASVSGTAITVQLPQELSQQWTTSNQVGLSESMPTGDGNSLAILVEKDFKCLTDRPGEEESDLYPHPKEGEVNC